MPRVGSTCVGGQRSFARERNHTVGKNLELKVSHAVDAVQNNAAKILPTHTTKPKPDDYSNAQLSGGAAVRLSAGLDLPTQG